MFRYRKHIQRWACRSLVVWLFAIAAGVANACLVADLASNDGQRRSEATVVAAVAPGATTAPAGTFHHGSHQAQYASTPGHGASQGTANCQDFCDKSSVSIPTVKSSVDGAGGHGLPPPALRVAVPIPDLPPVQQQTLGLEGGHAPPITIAFLRLAL